MSTPTLVGYARTSTADQEAGLEAQLRDLKAAGCAKIFSEQLSSVKSKRPQLDAALEWVREGDILLVTKLDRLARSVRDLKNIQDRLEAKGVGLRATTQSFDTSTSMGKLIVHVLGAIAEFERDIMLERQREGIAKAKGEGAYKGRPRGTFKKTAEVLAMRAEGKKVPAIVEALGISRASVFRIIKEAEGH
ncbi:MAG: recombinase family protein [Rhizobiaceae bacterium]